MQGIIGLSMNELISAIELRRRIDRDHNGPFEAFSAVDRDDLDRILSGVDAAFGRPDLSLPVSLKVADKGAQARDAVTPCPFDQSIEIRQRSRIAVLVAGRHDHSRVEPLNRGRQN